MSTAVSTEKWSLDAFRTKPVSNKDLAGHILSKVMKLEKRLFAIDSAAKLVKCACLAHTEHPTGYVHTYNPSTELRQARRNRSGWSGHGRTNSSFCHQCVFTVEEVM